MRKRKATESLPSSDSIAASSKASAAEIKNPTVDLEKDEDVEQAIKAAVDDALAHHAQRGNPIAVWREGRPQWLHFPWIKRKAGDAKGGAPRHE